MPALYVLLYGHDLLARSPREKENWCHFFLCVMSCEDEVGKVYFRHGWWEEFGGALVGIAWVIDVKAVNFLRVS